MWLTAHSFHEPRAAAGPDEHSGRPLGIPTSAFELLKKALQDAGIELTSVTSTVLTKSGRAILDAILAGAKDPTVLADLARGRLRSKIPQPNAGAHRFSLLSRRSLSPPAVCDEVEALAERAPSRDAGQVDGPADTVWNTHDLTTTDPGGKVTTQGWTPALTHRRCVFETNEHIEPESMARSRRIKSA